MLYYISHYYDSNPQTTSLLLECGYSETQMLSLTATLQYYAEELFGDQGILLSNECLKHILCLFFDIKDVKTSHLSFLPYLFSEPKDIYITNHFSIPESQLEIVQIDRYHAREFFSDTELDIFLNCWIPVCSDKEKELKELIFREGLE